MRRKQVRRGVSRRAAAIVFAISVGITAWMLWPRAAAPLDRGPSGDVDPATLTSEPSAADPERAPWRDLLAVHGSWEPRDPVRCAFTVFEFASSWAAPSGEVDAPVGRWSGEDPPQLRLGVVLISDGSRRAVLGGRVVGVGDEIQAAKVTGIERGVVTVSWAGKRLSYDLDGPVPREFRAELAARAAERAEGGELPAGGEPAVVEPKANESVQKETGK
jgi:hypothetical protein